MDVNVKGSLYMAAPSMHSIPISAQRVGSHTHRLAADFSRARLRVSRGAHQCRGRGVRELMADENVTAALLGPLLRGDVHRPRLTTYIGGFWTELSTASLANWSAATFRWPSSRWALPTRWRGKCGFL